MTAPTSSPTSPSNDTDDTTEFGSLERSTEELVNTITHGVGFATSIPGLVLLLVAAFQSGTTWHVVGCGLYGLTLVGLYGASTFYHGCRDPDWKHWLQMLDHAAIYLLIAGTYTPFMLLVLDGGLAWTLFAVVWLMAIAGVVLKFARLDQVKWHSLALYLGMGWLAVFAFEPLTSTLSATGFAWLIAGGVSYTVGTIFYLWESLPFNHGVWHLFVLAGSASHYVSIFQSVFS
jgi:hemolysin III